MNYQLMPLHMSFQDTPFPFGQDPLLEKFKKWQTRIYALSVAMEDE